MKKLVFIILLFLTKSIFGSIIYYQPFDLYKYDLYDEIYEIQIIDTLSSDTSDLNFLPIWDRITVNYKIIIKSKFKGNKIINDSVFSKSRSYKLEIGSRYLIFKGDSIGQVIEFEKDYSKQIENLKKLNLKRGYVVLDNGRQKIAEGKLKNGKRHGVWKFYYFVPKYFTSDNESIVFLKLSYRKGKLVSMENNINELYFSNNDFFNAEAEWFYYSQLSERSKKKYERSNKLLHHLRKETDDSNSF